MVQKKASQEALPYDEVKQKPNDKKTKVKTTFNEQNSDRRVQLLKMASNLLEVDAKQKVNRAELRLASINEENSLPLDTRLPNTSLGIKTVRDQQPQSALQIYQNEELSVNRQMTNYASPMQKRKLDRVQMDTKKSPPAPKIGKLTTESPYYEKNVIWFLNQSQNEPREFKHFQPDKSISDYKPVSQLYQKELDQIGSKSLLRKS